MLMKYVPQDFTIWREQWLSFHWHEMVCVGGVGHIMWVLSDISWAQITFWTYTGY